MSGALLSKERHRKAVLLLTCGILAGGVIFVQTNKLTSVTFDSFRDLAWAENIRAGRIAGDPVLADHPFWYAPGGPVVLAAVSAVFGVDPITACRTSPIWWNVWIPVLLMALVGVSAGPRTASLSILMVWLGSLWWLTHLVAPIPSIQGVVPGLASLLLWQWTLRRIGSRGRPPASLVLTSAVALGVTFWVHPVCALVAAAGVGGQGLLVTCFGGKAARVQSRGVAVSTLLVAGLSFLVAAPLLMYLARLDVVNPAPVRYAAAEIWNLDYALQLHVPLLLPLAAVGLWVALRDPVRWGWVVGSFVVACTGQIAGYIGSGLGVEVPWMVPHEFQWHTQVCTGVLAAIGLVKFGERVAGRLRWPADRQMALVLWIGGGFVATLAPALPFIPLAQAYLVDVERVVEGRREAIDWLRSSTLPGDVIACRPLLGHLVVSGLAGRKSVAVPVGHMNPTSDALQRSRDLETMLSSSDGGEVVRLAERYKVSHFYLEYSDDQQLSAGQRFQMWHWAERVFVAPRAPIVVFRMTGEEPLHQP